MECNFHFTSERFTHLVSLDSFLNPSSIVLAKPLKSYQCSTDFRAMVLQLVSPPAQRHSVLIADLLFLYTHCFLLTSFIQIFILNALIPCAVGSNSHTLSPSIPGQVSFCSCHSFLLFEEVLSSLFFPENQLTKTM